MAEKRGFSGFSINSKRPKLATSFTVSMEDEEKEAKKREEELKKQKRTLIMLNDEESEKYKPKEASSAGNEDYGDLDENSDIKKSYYQRFKKDGMSTFVSESSEKKQELDSAEPYSPSQISEEMENPLPKLPQNPKLPQENQTKKEEDEYEAYLGSLMETKTEGQDDTLDAFMEGIAKEAASAASNKPKIRRDDIEEEDDFDTFMKHRKELEKKGLLVTEPSKTEDGNEEENEEDEIAARKKFVPSLLPLDHSTIQYDEFNKEFYEEHPEISSMKEEDVTNYRKQLDVRVFGFNVSKPCKTFAHFGFEDTLLKTIQEEGFVEPTVIQKQAIPVALSGRDIIGIAKTGSGKTAAYLWPMLVHVMDQPELAKGDGPIAVIVAPTRELAEQIFKESRKYSKPFGIKCAPLYSGLSKPDQIKLLRTGCEVVVGTPGRLIEFIKDKLIKMNRVTYFVLDEADRMLDLGFEPQVRSIVGQIRPDRQTLLFSATFQKKVEEIANDILTEPVRIVVGTAGEANADIRQIVYVFNETSQKFAWLFSNIQSYASLGSVIVFASTIPATEDLARQLKEKGYHAAAMHGDKTTNERTEIMFAFKNENLPILVATDVAARGLDIKSVKTVINFDIARNIEAHTHRIGRTGRAGDKDGVAITLVTKKDNATFCSDLVRNLEGANQPVPQQLLDIALQNPKFRKNRQKLEAKTGNKGLYTGQGVSSSSGPTRGRGRGKVTAGIGYNPQQGPSSFSKPLGSSGSFSTYDRSAMMSSFKSAFTKSATDDTSMIANIPKSTPSTQSLQSPQSSKSSSNQTSYSHHGSDSHSRERKRDDDRRSKDKDDRRKG